MKVFLKILLIIMLLLLFAYTILIVMETVRLNNDANAKPIVLLNHPKCDQTCAKIGKEITIEYYGIGYKVNITYYHSEDSSKDNEIYNVTAKEFYLFNKILIWGWIS